jgi:PAS domain S-box-containing protein
MRDARAMNAAGDAGRARILLVEDNQDDYLLVEGVLPEGVYAITWCRNAREARERLASEAFDLVLLDHGLPDVNGLSFLEELRGRYPAHPVIVLTGRNDKALAVSSMKMGARTYLLKDEILDHLVDVVAEAVPHRQVSRAFRRAESKPKFVDTAERFYQVVTETMDEGCLIVDADGVITFANRALNELMRCDATSLPGRGVLELFAPEGATRVGQILGHFRAAHMSRSFVTEAVLAPAYARAPEDVAMVRISMRSMHRADGGFDAGLLMLTDLSELLRAKQLLAERYLQEKAQHVQLRAILESSRDGILLIDRSLRLCVVNGPVIALLGLPGGAEQWAGRSFVQLVQVMRRNSPDLARSSVREIQRMGSGDERPADGQVKVGERVLRWMNLPVQGDGSRLVVLQDITAEHSLRQMREDLVHMAVHDLRNPLGVITQSLEQVKELAAEAAEARARAAVRPGTRPGAARSDPGPAIAGRHWEEAEEWVDIAMQGARKMLMLVNSILDATRLESGEMPLARQVCTLRSLMESAVHEQASVAAARQVMLRCEHTPAESRAFIDPLMLGRVLQNLLDNAIRSTPAGGTVVLRVEPWPRRDETRDARHPREYCLVVADEGPGIPPELQGRLFERFATSRRNGAGLGLAFCKLAVEAHGGEIWAENATGPGATFRFTVPAASD